MVVGSRGVTSKIASDIPTDFTQPPESCLRSSHVPAVNGEVAYGLPGHRRATLGDPYVAERLCFNVNSRPCCKSHVVNSEFLGLIKHWRDKCHIVIHSPSRVSLPTPSRGQNLRSIPLNGSWFPLEPAQTLEGTDPVRMLHPFGAPKDSNMTPAWVRGTVTLLGPGTQSSWGQE